MRARGATLRIASLLIVFLVAMPCRAQPDPAVREWQRKIVEQVRTHLHAPHGFSDRTGEAWVNLEIDRAGRLKSTKLVRSTGIPELDTAALAAIEAAQPFPPPPEDNDSLLKIPAAIVFTGPMTGDINSSEEKLKAQLKEICRGC